MGLQVAPCSNVPCSPARGEVIQSNDSCADHSKSHLFITADCIPKYDTSLMPIVEETKSMQLAALAKANHDSEIAPCTTSSLSLRSHSAGFLLSQCSSLASLPSLGPTGSSDIYAEAQLLVDSGSCISAHHSCTTTLKSTGDQVASVGSSSDGFFYSASSACAALSLKTWSMQGGLYQISAGFGSKKEGAVRAILVVGNQVFSSHSDLKIRVWAKSGSRNREKVSCTGGGGGGDAKHRLVAVLPTRWDCITRAVTPGGYTQVRRHHRKLYIEHTDAISAMAVDAKQGCLYSGSWDRSIKVWRLRDFKCVESFRAHDDAINTLELSANGKYLYSGAADSKIRVWTWAGGCGNLRLRHSLVATLEAHRSAVNALALTADGGLLYSGACDKAIVVWEREDSAQYACLAAGALRGHRQAVLCLATWGNNLCSGSADKTIRVWQRLAGRLHVCLAVLEGHSAPVKSLTLSLSEQQLAPSASASAYNLACYSAALDHEIRVWQLNFLLPTAEKTQN